MEITPKKIIFIAFGMILLFLLIVFNPLYIVDAGHRGVKTTFGKVYPESLGEGIYFYNPLISSIRQMDVRTQKIQDKTESYTKDVQQATIQYAINFNLQANKAYSMFQLVGKDWQEILIPQAVSGALKNTLGKWDAIALISNREHASQEIENALKADLINRGIEITKFEIVDIAFAEAFEAAVEAKVTAIQRAAEAENKTIQVQEEAKQKIISAQAEAESMKIRSEALSQNRGLVEYEAVQKWDGKLPMYMMGNTTPFINVGNK